MRHWQAAFRPKCARFCLHGRPKPFPTTSSSPRRLCRSRPFPRTAHHHLSHDQFDAAGGIALQTTTALQTFLDNPRDDVDGMPVSAPVQRRAATRQPDQNRRFPKRSWCALSDDVRPGIAAGQQRRSLRRGITDDGEQYVAAILPVTHPTLPDDSTIDRAI